MTTMALKGWYLGIATLLTAAMVQPVKAATPYQGTYVIINPYTLSQANMLQTASQTSCAPGQPVASPFCGASNGILLRLPWCDFQLYHLKNAQNQNYKSCHYTVGYTKGVGSVGQQVASGDTVSPCAGSFDVCTGQSRSVLGTTLRYITQINAQRASAGLPPLNLSIGLYAGIGTPQSVLDAVGYADVPYIVSANNDASMTQCYRLPLSWKSQFLSAYEQALDQLVSYIQAQMPQGSNIAILKAAAVTATDLEIELPGQATSMKSPLDPGPAGPGPALSCSQSTPPAQTWLDAYNANPISGQTFSQANEGALGEIVGHEVATLANDGLQGALISIPTTNGNAYPYVDCGVTGTSTCAVKPNSGNWSIYYLQQYVTDMFNGGLSGTRAAAAYHAVRADTFSFPASQLSFNGTALSPAPLVPAQQTTCMLNNSIPAYAPTLSLDQTPHLLTGVGTTIGWQTSVNQGSTCSSGAYNTALNNGITQGGQFLEIEVDAAFTYIAQCSPALSSTLTRLLSIPSMTTCSY